jgi:hypothetical protein
MKTPTAIATILDTVRRPMRREALRREDIESRIHRYAPPLSGDGAEAKRAHEATRQQFGAWG